MRLNDSLCDRQAQARSRALELGLTRRVQVQLTHPIEFLKHQLVMLCIDTDPRVRDSDLDLLTGIEQPGLHADISTVRRELASVDQDVAKGLI